MTKKRDLILFIEDDRVDQMAFTRFVEDGSFPYDYILAGSIRDAGEKLSTSPTFDAIIMDYLLGDGTAFDLFDKANGIPIILVTGTGDIDIAIQAMKKGAYDYLEKDPHGNYLKALAITIDNAILRKKTADELVQYRQHLEELVEKRTADLQQAVEKYKKAEDELVENRERFRHLVETTSDWVWEIDSAGVFTYASPKIHDILGYKPDELIGKFPTDFMPREEARRIAEIFAPIIATQQPFSLLENTNIHKEGHQVTLETSGVPIYNSDGVFCGYRGIDRDITERKYTEQQIEQALAMQRMINQLLQAALEPVTLDQHLEQVLDKIMALPWPEMQQHGAIFLVNDDNPGLLTMKVSKGLDKRQQEFCRQVAFGTCVCGRAAESREFQVIEGDDACHEIKLKGGEPHSHYCVPILSSGDNVLGVISLYFQKGHVCSALEKENLVAIARTLASIIEHFRAGEKRQQLYEQLIQAQKMESIGRLAGGVAHDFNNMLSVINGYADLILMKVADDNPLKEYVEVILTSGKRAADLTRQLLAFSRKEIIKPKVLNLNDVINEGQKIIGRLIGEDIAIEIIHQEDLWDIMADQTQLNQIIMNLAVNARDAMPGGGKLTIETRNVLLDEQNTQLPSYIGAGEYVMLKISDSGIGMTKEIMSQVFEPFFTTKGIDKGTGLGLSTVYGIVKQNQGNIDVQSVVGRGTTFDICFPRTEYDANSAGSQPFASIPRGSETILLAEDDPSIRKLAARMLTDLGYSVFEAENGRQALDICERYTTKIDLLLTDVIMPEMSGNELAAKLETSCGALKVLFMSGYTGDYIALQDVIDKGAHFLQKPISFDSLAQAVRRVLDKPID